ncbi:hypothetical protein TNCV_85731 [Trichonephila clavipes]|nr:hypothetical protein TNCV_85731 [Trichonephila clavipes]
MMSQPERIFDPICLFNHIERKGSKQRMDSMTVQNPAQYILIAPISLHMAQLLTSKNEANLNISKNETNLNISKNETNLNISKNGTNLNISKNESSILYYPITGKCCNFISK